MTNEAKPGLQEQMRQGLTRAAQRTKGLQHASGISLVAMLCAAALTPVAVATSDGKSVLTAGLGVAGSVGANALTDLAINVADRLRSAGGKPSPAAVEQELAAALEQALDGNSETAMALREAAATLLRSLGAVSVLMDQAGEQDAEILKTMVDGFTLLGDQFGEFAFMMADMRAALWAIQASVKRRESVPREERHELAELVQHLLDAVGNDRLRQEISESGQRIWRGCPYLGVQSFKEKDSQIYHGRVEMTARLVRRLSERIDSGGIFVVTGPSGAGKSSLISAGALPHLTAGVLAPGSGRWPRITMTPTASPLRALTLHLAALSGIDPVSAYHSLLKTPSEIPLMISHAVSIDTGFFSDPHAKSNFPFPRLVIVVDQFEELFNSRKTDQASQVEFDAFVAALDAAASVSVKSGRPGALVIAVLRGDYLGPAMAYPQLAAQLEEGVFTVTPMTEAQLRQTIVGPAAEAGLLGAADVADAVIAELRSAGSDGELGSGVLPFVSQAMADTWELREDDRLTVQAYHRVGGATNAVNRSAQAAYDSLTSRQQEAARLIFTRLTFVGMDGRREKCRRTRADLLETLPTDFEPSDVVIAYDAFSKRRLLVATDDGIEIAHDVLLRAWEQLRDWLSDDLIDRARHDQFTADARTWNASGRKASYLYRPERVPEISSNAERWALTPSRFLQITPVSSAFLDASRRSARRAILRRRFVSLGLVALTVAALIGGGLSWRDATNASRQHGLALSRQLAAESVGLDESDPFTATRLAVAAWSVFPTSQAASAMDILLSEQMQNGEMPAAPSADGVNGVAFSSDGRLLASAGGDGCVRLWNPTTGELAGRPMCVGSGNNAVNGVAFSPDGHLLASAGANGYVRLWNPTTGKPVGSPLLAAAGKGRHGIRGVAFSPDGHLLASAGANGYVRLWNPTTGKPVGSPLPADPHDPAGPLPVNGVAFSPDGRLLASADQSGYVRLWNPTTGKPVGSPLPADPSNGIRGVAFSPVGHLLASADANGYVRLWNPTTGKPVGSPLPADPNTNWGVLGVAFSQDGRVLASADDNDAVRLWNLATGKSINTTLATNGLPLPAGTADSATQIRGVAFSPRGHLLASADQDGYVRLWDPSTGKAPGSTVRISPTDDAVNQVALSPDGKILASANSHGDVRLLKLATGTLIGPPMRAGSNDDNVNAVAFSPNGHLLASADDNGYIRLWNPTTRNLIGPPLPVDTVNNMVVHNHSGAIGVTAIEFNSDGKLLASADKENRLRFWNPVTQAPTSPSLPVVTGKGEDEWENNNLWTIAFSSDKNILASGDAYGYIRLWNPTNDDMIGSPFRASSTTLTSLAFSPNGNLLASGGINGYIRLWNPATGTPIGPPLPVDTGNNNGGVAGLAFAPGGHLLISVGYDGSVHMINPATQAVVGALSPSDSNSTTETLGMALNTNILATANNNGTVGLFRWKLLTRPYAVLCASAGPPSDAEWNKFASGEPRPEICSH